MLNYTLLKTIPITEIEGSPIGLVIFIEGVQHYCRDFYRGQFNFVALQDIEESNQVNLTIDEIYQFSPCEVILPKIGQYVKVYLDFPDGARIKVKTLSSPTSEHPYEGKINWMITGVHECEQPYDFFLDDEEIFPVIV